MSIRNHRDLRVWRAAIALAKSCYALTSRFPDSQRFGLISQIRRAASAIPANIAEGHGRSSRKEYLQFLSIARASLQELDSHLRLAGELEFAAAAAIIAVIERADGVGKQLFALMRSLRRLG